MPIMLSQRWRQTATERTPFGPFTGMRVDALAAQDQRVGGGAAVLMPSEAGSRHRVSAIARPLSRWWLLSRSRVLRLGPRRRAIRACIDPRLIPDGPHE